jgi:U5 small nuclear ribonucleoprotein component
LTILLLTILGYSFPDEPESLHRAVILHEDKSYYRDADDVFKGAEVTVQEEDTMSINEPILKRETLRKFQHIEKAAEFPPVGYSKEYVPTASLSRSLFRCARNI